MEAFKFDKHIIVEAISIEMSVAEAKAVLEFLDNSVAYGNAGRETKEMLIKILESGLEKRNEAEPELYKAVAVDENDRGVPF